MVLPLFLSCLINNLKEVSLNTDFIGDNRQGKTLASFNRLQPL